jgi:aminoglycoside phosphotransferase (APT) family kinase protein
MSHTDATVATPHGTTLTDAELARLADALHKSGTTPAGPLQTRLISGGRSNLTYRLTDGTTTWVLRTPPRSGRTPSAHDVVREFRVTSALAGTDVPVAQPVLLVEDESVLSVPLTVVEYVDAESLRMRTDLDRLTDAEVNMVVTRLVEVLAALHRVDHVAVGLERFGRPNGYAERQLKRWAGQWALVGAPTLAQSGEQVAELLRTHLPRQQRQVSIVHGDYRLDNTMVRLDREAGRAEIAAVVDWELSTIGDPVADVALMCAYHDPVFNLIVGEPSSWTSPRLPDAAALSERYEQASGLPLTDFEFHLALAYFKIGVIAAGIAHRHRAGAGDGAAGYASAGESVARYFELAYTTLKDLR